MNHSPSTAVAEAARPAVSDDALRSQLELLLTERDIRDTLMRFCRGVDRCDRALIESCFHEDGVDDHGGWRAQGAKAIADEIIKRVQPGDARSMHFMGNVAIEIEGTTAFVESYVMSFRAVNDSSESSLRTRGVRSVDRFTLRAGKWRVSERVLVEDWNRFDPKVEMQPASAQFHTSTKSRQDPVYAIRQGRVARETSAS